MNNDLHQAERSWDSAKMHGSRTWDEVKDTIRSGWDHFESKVEDFFRRDRDHWRRNYTSRDYVRDGEPFETYEPAYRYGYKARAERVDDTWETVENDLERGWESFKGATKLTWNEAKGAVRDGWHRLEAKFPGDLDNDGR